MAEHENIPKQRPQFGKRFLVDQSKVFEHNAWDNVVWNEEQEEAAIKVVNENASVKVPYDMQEKYNCDADEYWNSFYMQHNNRFFKDRHWLFTEFPELTLTSTKTSNACNLSHRKLFQTGEEELFPGSMATKKILEVGCGVGNTVFPILQTNKDPELFVYCCDFSSVAIDLIKQHTEYQNGRCHGFVCDITKDDEFPFPVETLDVILLLFVLSAIHPQKFEETIAKLSKYLKPGGIILFRDYGRYDMAQLRFKKENFYVRGDGTRCYFFSQDDVKTLFTKEGLHEEQNYVDRRLQVNRGRQVKMYRVWIQAKYRKNKR